MRPSFYNYYLTEDDGSMTVFNGLSKRFFRVGSSAASPIRQVLESPDANFEKYKRFLLRMQAAGFVAGDDVDEFRLVRQAYDDQRASSRYTLVVYATYQCNLRCWYCTQPHRDLRLSEETKIRLERHISRYLLQNHIKEFYLSWFGGEPLLEYGTIAEVTSFAREFCSRNGIRFGGGMTTNGTLLTEDKVHALRKLHLTHYQITLDGGRSQHNRVKSLPGASAFDLTVRNVRTLVERMPEADCSLRINYTDKTDVARVIQDINDAIPHHLRNRINVVPRKVWQVEEASIPASLVHDLRSSITDSDFRLDCKTLGLCYVAHSHYHTIFPDGGVTKCDNDRLTDRHGHLDERGDIVTDRPHLFEGHSPLDAECECSRCKHLPICWGPCPRSMEEMLERTGNVHCKYANPDTHVRDYIDGYVASVTGQTKAKSL